MLRGILTVGIWTMASRLLGFARDVLIADRLGTGLVADAFFVALKLPNLFRRLFGEGAFNAAFVPAFAGTLASFGREPARRLAGEVASALAVWLAGITVLGIVFMPQLMVVLAPGFAALPAKLALTVTLTRIAFPYLMLMCLSALFGGMLNGLDRFAAAAGAPVLFNVFLIGALLLPPVAMLPTTGHLLAAGLVLSGFAQLGVLVLAVRIAGMAPPCGWPRLTPGVRTVLRRMGPGVIGAGVTQLNVAVDTVIASLLPAGTVSVLYYADRVDQLPLGVIGVAVGTAILPLLSRQVRAGDKGLAITTLNHGIEYALVLTLPAALALSVAGGPIMSVLFARGAFDAMAAAKSAQALAAYAVGLPAYVLAKVFAPGFFARGDTATPVKIGLVAVALNLVLNLAFMRPLGHIGPPLATSIAAAFNAAALAVLLYWRGYFRPDAALGGRLARMVLAAGAMTLVLLVLDPVLFAIAGGRPLLRAAALVMLVGTGLVGYGAAGQALGAFDLLELGRTLLRRRFAAAKPRG